MLYADKEHLKTEVAVDLLRVREKEVLYYARNLSTVGTQVNSREGRERLFAHRCEGANSMWGGVHKPTCMTMQQSASNSNAHLRVFERKHAYYL
eukprot:5155615-Pleurochrysis_carterae.AAC.3